ncbi:pyrimidine dimer DNA glycosylase/endonuclease V [Georgenia thermotolerans]|uniref:Uncharacterized protein n=1 Tax=Georgenia thermotolerans TaxID=527326 RepID=A0A7J5ULD7_9MICO|nr:pyrimidine dimer DNA glycosylase/endonuclease V [Georgenia thermotolerans]KAE8763172.1 hypothetical protein GB883_15590 [Georgenia thermotolerans]
MRIWSLHPRYLDRQGLTACWREGQVAHEWGHLAAKLAARSPARAAAQRDVTPAVHPLFVVVPGPVEAWERV